MLRRTRRRGRTGAPAQCRVSPPRSTTLISPRSGNSWSRESQRLVRARPASVLGSYGSAMSRLSRAHGAAKPRRFAEVPGAAYSLSKRETAATPGLEGREAEAQRKRRGTRARTRPGEADKGPRWRGRGPARPGAQGGGGGARGRGFARGAEGIGARAARSGGDRSDRRGSGSVVARLH